MCIVTNATNLFTGIFCVELITFVFCKLRLLPLYSVIKKNGFLIPRPAVMRPYIPLTCDTETIKILQGTHLNSPLGLTRKRLRAWVFLEKNF